MPGINPNCPHSARMTRIEPIMSNTSPIDTLRSVLRNNINAPQTKNTVPNVAKKTITPPSNATST